MKNKILLICAILLLFIFLVFGTYAWYIFFLSSSGNLDILNNNNLRYGDIVFKDDGVSVYDENALSIEDIEVGTVIPYKFRVINEGNKEGEYTLYIEDLPVNAINDGCGEETLLTRDLLKYQLKLNGSVLKEDYMSNINDNILDTGKIMAGKTNNYELRIYIHDEALDWMGKHYHYKVVLNNSN